MAAGPATWRPLGLDSSLHGRPLGAPAVSPVPHRGTLELLPLDALEWPEFETLLWRILGDVEGLRHPQIYGTPGQTQLGLDIVALAPDDSGVAVQSKRHKNFGPSKITEAVDAFRNTSRPFAVSKFVIGVSREVRSTASVAKFWELRKELTPVDFVIWDQRELSMRLKRAPRIVIDYFGMEIARAFCEPFVIDDIVVPGHDAAAVAEAVARTPEATTGAIALVDEALRIGQAEPGRALDLIDEAQTRLEAAGFAPHARRYEPQRADLLVALGRGSEATRRRLDGVWLSLEQGLLTSAEIAVRDIAVLAERVSDATSGQHSQVADIALRLYANPLAAVPDASDLNIGSPTDAARLLALAGETALAADNLEWLSANAGRLLSIASDARDVTVAVRLRILAAEGSSDWAALLLDARATRLGFGLGGLVTARHARHKALHGRFEEADASWDEAAGSACLAAQWSDAATWTFSRRAFSARWNPLRSDDLLPVQTALAARGPVPRVLPRDDDASEYAYSCLSEDRLRPAAIAAQRALRDSITGSDWEGERRARRLLADILQLSDQPQVAAEHLARAGEVKAVQRLGLAHPTLYLNVSDLLTGTSYWVAGTAYRLIATQADLVPDAAVDVIADSALGVLDAARDGSLIDLVGWAGSRYLGAIAALAGIASRVSPDRAERCLAYFEEQPAVEPGHYRYHDDDEAAAVAGIAAACPELRGRALTHLVALLGRSQTSRSAESVRPVEDHFADAQGLLTALAVEGNMWAQEFLASRAPDGVPGETADAALGRLTTPLVHTPGVHGFGGGGSAITDSVLVAGLPSARLEDALVELMQRADDRLVASGDRSSYLIAAANLALSIDAPTRSVHLAEALRLVVAPSLSEADAFGGLFGHPLGAVRLTRPGDSRAQAVHLAASLAVSEEDKEKVRQVALRLIGDDVSDYWLTRAFQRLGDAMSPDVGFMSGGEWAQRSLAALLWARTGSPPTVGRRLLADTDVRVRRALAQSLADEASNIPAGDAREEVWELLAADPCHSVRTAAAGQQASRER